MSTTVYPVLPGLSWPIVRTPMFNTLVQTASSGEEYRAALEAYPRWKWTLTYDWLRIDNGDWQALLNFYIARNGQFDSFLFTDPDDFTVTASQLGVGDGTTVAFQLVRPFGGTGGFVEPILAPNVVSQVKVGGVVKTPITDYQVLGWENGLGIRPGQIIFTSGAPPSGQAVTATFTYYWPARFNADNYQFSKFMDRRYEVDTIELISVKNDS